MEKGLCIIIILRPVLTLGSYHCTVIITSTLDGASIVNVPCLEHPIHITMQPLQMIDSQFFFKLMFNSTVVLIIIIAVTCGDYIHVSYTAHVYRGWNLA